MRGWWVWFIAFFAFGWFVRGLGSSAAQISQLKTSVRELSRLTLSMDKRLWKLEGGEPSGELTDEEFYDRLGL
jgi:hypothetical protein